MPRLSILAMALVGVLVLISTGSSGEQRNTRPPLGLDGAREDIAPYLMAMMDAIGEGSIDRAIDLFTQRGVGLDLDVDDVRRVFANIFTNLGEYEGSDLVAVRQVTPRLQYVYLVGYFNVPVTMRCRFYFYDNEWKLHAFYIHPDQAGFEALEKAAPIQFLNIETPAAANGISQARQ